MGAEQKVREAAAALLQAIAAAKAEGLSIQWPTHAEGLASLAISQTNRVAAGEYVYSGGGIDFPETGSFAGEPINLTDEERAALPPLDPVGNDQPPVRGRSGRVPKK